MLPVKKKVEPDGRIAIGEVLKMAKIQPDDWVEIIPTNNKVTIKMTKRRKPKGKSIDVEFKGKLREDQQLALIW